MKMSEMEERLRKHTETTKAFMTAPLNIQFEREETSVKKFGFGIKKYILIAAAAVFLIGTTVFAAYHLLSAKEATEILGDKKLAESFDETKPYSETVTDGDYKATILGITSGENLSDFKNSSWDIYAQRTYAVVAVEKTDGTEMTYDDEILVTPLIEGLKPWQYNIFTMNGGYTAQIIDGVLYRIIEFDSIEYFADREVYMAVLSAPFLNNQSYSFDEKTGKIAPKDDYDGTNILIPLKLDKSKADPEKARKYLENLNEKVEVSEKSSDNKKYKIEKEWINEDEYAITIRD